MTTATSGATGRTDGSVGIIEMTGQVSRHSDAAVNAAYEEATKNGVASLDLRFENVDYINSTGIAVIVGVLARARTDGLPVSAHGLTDHYKHVFQITRLADFMKIEDSEGGEA
jgi:anti-anti-sigma factor